MAKGPKIKTEEELSGQIPGWDRIEELIKEDNVYSLILALIEADKLLFKYLKDKGFPGSCIEEKIAFAGEQFSNLPKLTYARQLRKNIVEKFGFNTTTLDLKEALASYRQALIDLDVGGGTLGLFDRIYLYLQYTFPKKLKLWRRWIGGIILFFIIVWFASNTYPGQILTKVMVDLVNLIFSWVLAIILLVLGVIIVVGATIFYFEKRKRQQ